MRIWMLGLTLVACVGPHVEAKNPNCPHHNCTHPCSGISPTGVKWGYQMPEHTATLEIVGAINKAGIPCEHTHRFGNFQREQQPQYNKGFVAFTFLTNPFHRVLSHATHLDLFGEHPGASESAEEHIETFRRYVRGQRNRQLRLEQQRRKAAPGGVEHVKSYEHVMGGTLHMDTDLYGRVNHLSEDLPKIFERLGYTDPVLLEGLRNSTLVESHCMVTCDSARIHPGFSKMRADKSQWYDEATATQVVELYQADFEVYGFSKDPAKMWIDTGNRSSFHNDLTHRLLRKRRSIRGGRGLS